jgi:MFS family permease
MLILLILILSERKKKIRLSNMGGSILLTFGAAICMALYAYEYSEPAIALFVNTLDGKEAVEEFNAVYHEMSNGRAIFQLILLTTLFIPFAAGVIYIIAALIKRPLERHDGENPQEYDRLCAVRHSTLGILCSAVMIVCIAATVLLTIPYWDYFKDSLDFLNPIVVLFVAFFTFGIGIPFLLSSFVAMNAQLMLIILAGVMLISALYCFSVIYAVAACVRAAKCKAVSPVYAFVSGIFMFMIGWNIIPLILIRKKLKKQTIYGA